MTKKFEIHKQRLAEQDLQNIWLYSFKNWGMEQADEYLDKINEALISIANNPEIGLSCDYIKKDYRQFHAEKHMIFYRISGNKIRVIRVLGEGMLFAKHL